MTNPWTELDAATQDGKLYLEPGVERDLQDAFDLYEARLQQILIDALDDTTEYFGTKENPLAVLLEQAFNKRGEELTDYVEQQLKQAQDFMKTAKDAAQALRDNEGD